MAQLNAGDVRIFPISNRTANTGNNFATEYNIASIINQLTGSDGFVITETFDVNKEFSFNIAGYCFTIEAEALDTVLKNVPDSATNLYAYISFSNTGGNIDYRKISGEDAAGAQGDETTFVNFTVDKNIFSAAGNTGLIILARENVSQPWKIPDTSRIKFIPHQDFSIDNGRVK